MFVAASLKQKLEESTRILQHEFESERLHHQKLVKDHTRLQQRFENLRSDVRILSSPPEGSPAPAHKERNGNDTTVDLYVRFSIVYFLQK